MIKVIFERELDYVSGHLRNGYEKLEKEFNTMKEAKEWIKSEEGKEEFRECANIEVTDFEINDIGRDKNAEISIRIGEE